MPNRESEIENHKVYKVSGMITNNMFPSDPTGSLDDFSKKFKKEVKWRRH